MSRKWRCVAGRCMEKNTDAKAIIWKLEVPNFRQRPRPRQRPCSSSTHEASAAESGKIAQRKPFHFAHWHWDFLRNKHVVRSEWFGFQARLPCVVAAVEANARRSTLDWYPVTHSETLQWTRAKDCKVDTQGKLADNHSPPKINTNKIKQNPIFK